MTTKIDFKTLKAGKVIPDVWVVTCGTIKHETQFKKLSEFIYDTRDGNGWGMASHLDSFFTSELEALEAARDYRLKALDEINERINKLQSQTND